MVETLKMVSPYKFASGCARFHGRWFAARQLIKSPFSIHLRASMFHPDIDELGFEFPSNELPSHPLKHRVVQADDPEIEFFVTRYLGHWTVPSLVHDGNFDEFRIYWGGQGCPPAKESWTDAFALSFFKRVPVDELDLSPADTRDGSYEKFERARSLASKLRIRRIRRDPEYNKADYERGIAHYRGHWFVASHLKVNPFAVGLTCSKWHPKVNEFGFQHPLAQSDSAPFSSLKCDYDDPDLRFYKPYYCGKPVSAGLAHDGDFDALTYQWDSPGRPLGNPGWRGGEGHGGNGYHARIPINSIEKLRLRYGPRSE